MLNKSISERKPKNPFSNIDFNNSDDLKQSTDCSSFNCTVQFPKCDCSTKHAWIMGLHLCCLMYCNVCIDCDYINPWWQINHWCQVSSKKKITTQDSHGYELKPHEKSNQLLQSSTREIQSRQGFRKRLSSRPSSDPWSPLVPDGGTWPKDKRLIDFTPCVVVVSHRRQLNHFGEPFCSNSSADGIRAHSGVISSTDLPASRYLQPSQLLIISRRSCMQFSYSTTSTGGIVHKTSTLLLLLALNVFGWGWGLVQDLLKARLETTWSRVIEKYACI